MPYQQFYPGGYQNSPNTSTPAQAAALNAMESQYLEAVLSFGPDAFAAGFIYSGLAASATVGTTSVALAAGTAYPQQSDGSFRQRLITAQTVTTSTPSATYYLDLNPDGSLSWGTAHSTQANSLTLCQVTTDTSGNVSSLTDTRTRTPSLLPHAQAPLALPGIKATAPSSLDTGAISTDGLGTVTGSAPTPPAAPTLALASSATYKSTILADSPLRYYRLDEATGTTATDLGSSAQNGTYTGGFTLNQPGALSGDTDAAVKFNGSTGSVSASGTGLPTSGAFSLECWALLTATPTGTAVPLAIGSPGVNGAEFYLAFPASTAIWAGDGTTNSQGPALTSNAWHHLVASYDGANIRVYADGALVAGPTAASIAPTYGGLFIGQLGNSTDWFAGSVDEVAVYGVALSSTQVSTHYAAGRTCLGIGAYQYAATLASPSSETSLGTSATITTTAGNQRVQGSALSLGPTGTAKRNLYRTKQGGSTFYLLTSINDNTTTTFTDTTPDSALGAALAAHPSAGGDVWKNAAGQTVAQVYGDGYANFQGFPNGLWNIGGQASVGGFGVPVIVAQAINQHVTSTTTQTILAYLVPTTGIYRVSLFFTLNNGTSGQSISATVSWTDPNTNAGAAHYLATIAGGVTALGGSGSVVNGSYATFTETFYASAGGYSFVTYTDPGGTPNDYVTAIIERLA